MGSNATVQAGLEKLVADTGADEVIVVTDTYEPPTGCSRISEWPKLLRRSRRSSDDEKSPLSMFIHRASLSA